MRTLAGMFELMRALGRREALRYHNGYRTRKFTYRDLLRHSAAFARFLDERGLHKGDRLILWAENRPEWAAVFWACVARGVEVVPIDFRSSPQLAGRIQREVGAKVLISGDEVEASKLDVETFSINEVNRLPEATTFEPALLSEDDVVEIVFTSGTTGEPKGVVHRHRNICANLNPIHREINRFKMAARPFQPIRLLDLLPLSHLFGQSTGLMIPVLLGGAAVFTSELHAAAILETIRREKVSAVVSVPRFLQNLQQEVERKFDLSGRQPSRKGLLGAAERWWLYRDVHRRLGWKFWAFVVGGAQLEPEREDFWRRLGFVVVQGYGLTETSPVVAMNHPFFTRRGSIGKALHGQQIKLAPDGEILVRGASVVEDYVGAGASETRVEGGWLHTGDVGEIDAEGRLYFKGRKKEVIVTSEGLNVYPQDIEALLNRLPQVRDSVIVPRRERGEERVHAVLILSSPDADVASVVRSANQQLESHQRIQSWSLWPGDDFPRTASTMKIKRNEVLRQVTAEAEGAPVADQASAASQQSVRGILSEMTGRGSSIGGGDIRGSDIAPSARLAEDLGFSSLQRVELLARIENDLDVELDEERFAAITTVEELENWVAAERHASAPQFRAADSPPRSPSAPASHAPSADESSFPEPSPREPSLPRTAPRTEPSAAHMRPSAQSEVVPRWNRLLPVRWLRRLLLDLALLPAFRQLVRLRVRGLDNLDGVRGPVIFAANHASHFDTPAVLAALPLKWRRKVAPAMSQDYFRRYFQSANVPFRLRLKLAAQYYMACGLFNAYPLPQQMAGTRRALKYTGELIDEGWCPLVYPEGERTPTGLMQTFKGGIGLMAARLGVPIVPIYIRGMFEVYSEHDDWPRPGNVVVHFGRPLDLQGDLQGDLHGCLHGEKSYSQAAARIETAVRDLAKET